MKTEYKATSTFQVSILRLTPAQKASTKLKSNPGTLICASIATEALWDYDPIEARQYLLTRNETAMTNMKTNFLDKHKLKPDQWQAKKLEHEIRKQTYDAHDDMILDTLIERNTY